LSGCSGIGLDTYRCQEAELSFSARLDRRDVVDEYVLHDVRRQLSMGSPGSMNLDRAKARRLVLSASRSARKPDSDIGELV